MLLKSGEMPHGPAWMFEPKWDGFRVLVHLGDPWRALRVVSRHGNDLTERFPELERLAEAAQGRRLVLDGELVICGDDGRPDFDRLRARLTTRSMRLRGAAAAAPAVFIAFDVLWADADVTQEAYDARRELLVGLRLEGHACHVTPATSDGSALWEAVREHSLEGIVAKRRASRYQPGRRSGDWVKVKNWQHLDPYVGGFTVGRNGLARSLLLGLPADAENLLPLGEPTPPLRYIGEVEYGFRGEERAEVTALLAEHVHEASPFTHRTRHEGVVCVRPAVRVRVQFQCWGEGRLRHAIFRGLSDPQASS
jgi:bifunctional non-homologous end joining protein LigD